jgi:hypothetical protein
MGGVWLGIGLVVLACSAWRLPAPHADSTRTPASPSSIVKNDTAAWAREGGGVARIEYTLPKAGHVHVRVFDAAGREFAHPVDEWQTAGTHHTAFAFGPSTAKQVFSYRVECGRRKRSGKITVEP